jgi:hypothetical protein
VSNAESLLDLEIAHERAKEEANSIRRELMGEM